MSKLILSAFISAVLLTAGFQAANAQPSDDSRTNREHVCKELQRNCN